MDQITPVIDFQHELGDLFDVTGKVAYLPGGYGGIGAAIAWGLAQRGAKIVVSSGRLHWDRGKSRRALLRIPETSPSSGPDQEPRFGTSACLAKRTVRQTDTMPPAQSPS